MSVKRKYDATVVGLGGMGSAALYHLAKRGISVCGIEQFEFGHKNGSSHGETRIIRKAYPEEPKYIPLLNRSYELWAELEEASGTDLLIKSGFIAISEAGSEFLKTIGEGNRQYNLPHEYWTADDIRKHAPQFNVPDSMAAFYDPLGGFVYVEKCQQAHLMLAKKQGAAIYENEAVQQWKAVGDGVEISTQNGKIHAGKLILTTGAWAIPELNKLGISMELWRRLLFWFRSPDANAFQPQHFPSFVIDLGETVFYGTPSVSDFGAKVGEHHQPFLINRPEEMSQPHTEREISTILKFTRIFFPALDPQPSKSANCMYTVTPDHHFILDLHPQNNNIILGCGFSGHGFKFSSAVGEVLADLALNGISENAIDFLRISRFE